MVQVKKPPAEPKVVDGIYFPPGVTDFQAQLWLFRYSPRLQVAPDVCPLPPEQAGKWDARSCYTGTGRYGHCRILIEALFPTFQWHKWSERAIRALCEHDHNAWSGCAGSGKSTCAGAYAMVFLACGLWDKSTSVRIASTTISAAMGRIWKNIAEFYADINARLGGLGEARIYGKPIPEIRAAPDDFAHGMFVTAVAQGEIQKAIDRLKGKHTLRILLIGDETDSISQAIVDVQDNLRVGCEEFQTIWLGNLPSMFNPLGKIMEPAPNTPVTEACGQEWTSSTGVHCLRFDGEDSPNIEDGDKWKGIIRQKDIDATLSRNHGVKGQQYWIMVKGLPPPEGVDDTVLSEATLSRFHVREPVTWMRDFTTFATLDPGFGGDPCMLKIFKRGPDTDGRMKILFSESLPIPIDSTDPTNPAEYQIAAKVKDLCLSRGVQPDEFIIGSTGTGRGAAAVLQREWSPLILTCEEGGSASSLPVSNEDARPANEVYDRRITELWFSVREFVMADMIRGMDTPTCQQLCSRKWLYKGVGTGKRIVIERKEDMKARGIPSPNDGDCAAMACDLLRRKGINATSTGQTALADDTLEREAAEYDFEEAYA